MKPFGPSGRSTDLRASLDAPGAARRLVRESLLSGGVDPGSAGGQAAILLVSEMATNAVVHAVEPIRVQIDLTDAGVLRLAVCDGDPHDLPERKPVQPDQIGGWGVELIGRLSDAWGSGPRPDGEPGKEVWAVLDVELAGQRYAATG